MMRLQHLSFTPERGWSQPIDDTLNDAGALVIAFGAPRFGDETRPFEQLRAALPRASFVGCSTAGEIHGTKVSDDSVVAAVMRFEHTQVRTASATVQAPADSFVAGESLGRALYAQDLAGVLLFSDGICVNGSELVRGIHSVIAGRAVVTGGLAGDGSRFKRTWVLHEGRPVTGMVVAAGLYGERLHMGYGSKGGWDIFGPERVVTRSEGNVLYELDGRPALQLYKEYLGDRAAGLPATALLFPLALRSSGLSDKRLVRTILGIDEAGSSMTFAGDIPCGALAQLMRANFDRLVQGASDAALMTRRGQTTPGPVLAIAVSCVGRRLVLGERTEEETEATLDALPGETCQVGFYSYGEISPDADGTCDLHNQTMTLTTIWEG